MINLESICHFYICDTVCDKYEMCQQHSIYDG